MLRTSQVVCEVMQWMVPRLWRALRSSRCIMPFGMAIPAVAMWGILQLSVDFRCCPDLVQLDCFGCQPTGQEPVAGQAYYQSSTADVDGDL